MNRPCLDPTDPDCPPSAPNKDLREVSTHTRTHTRTRTHTHTHTPKKMTQIY